MGNIESKAILKEILKVLESTMKQIEVIAAKIQAEDSGDDAYKVSISNKAKIQ